MRISLNHSAAEIAHELLEDFELLKTMQHAALIPRRHAGGAFEANIRAALIASTLRLRSLDYARRRYVEDLFVSPKANRHEAYVTAFKAAKLYVKRIINKVNASEGPEPTVGVFGASLVLERLPASFFCAHLLYRLGHKYEGHAVARIILEQLAWAYAAHSIDNIEAIKRISTTGTISLLKGLLPEAGRIYGFLSSKTHIDYSSHEEFLKIEGNANFVIHAKEDFVEFAQVILTMADYFGIVWEATQLPYIDDPEAVFFDERAKLVANPARPFAVEMANHLTLVKKHSTS